MQLEAHGRFSFYTASTSARRSAWAGGDVHIVTGSLPRPEHHHGHRSGSARINRQSLHRPL